MGKFVGIACLSLCLLLSSCNLVGERLFQSADKTIRYEISGTASSVKVEYKDSYGYMITRDDETLPWSESITVKVREFETFSPSINVTNNGETGYVTVDIWVDDELIKRESRNKTVSVSVQVNYDE